MASGIYMNESAWSSPLIESIKSKTEGSWIYVGRHAVGSHYQKLHIYYQITATRDILKKKKKKKKNNKKGEMRFFENIFSLDFF